MHVGVVTFVTDEGIGVTDLAVALEERGFESLVLAEHTHIPVNNASPYPGGGPIPRSVDLLLAQASQFGTPQAGCADLVLCDFRGQGGQLGIERLGRRKQGRIGFDDHKGRRHNVRERAGAVVLLGQ